MNKYIMNNKITRKKQASNRQKVNKGKAFLSEIRSYW